MAQNKRRLRKKRPVRRGLINGIIIFFIACCIGGITYSLSIIMPQYAKFDYENHLEHLSLPEITEPSHLQLKIWYVNQKPTDIKIVPLDPDARPYQNKTDIVEIPEEKAILIDAELLEPLAYELTLMPQDNYELSYEILAQEEAHTKIYCKPELYYDSNNHLILEIKAYYKYSEQNFTSLIRLDGTNYSPILYDDEIVNQMDETTKIDLTQQALKKGIDMNTDHISDIFMNIAMHDHEYAEEDIFELYRWPYKDYPVYNDKYKKEHSKEQNAKSSEEVSDEIDSGTTE